MPQIVFRALVTIVTGAAAALFTSDDEPGGQLRAAVVVAVVIALAEWLMQWAPTRARWARRLLDPNSRQAGIWVQDVKRVSPAGSPSDRKNRFALYTVDYVRPQGYFVTGRAYDESGHEHARWESEGSVSFGRNGHEMHYVFDGQATGGTDDHHFERKGLARIVLRTGDSGTGRVEHVAENVGLEFDVHRVTPSWLKGKGLGSYRPKALWDFSTGDEFALEYSGRLAPQRRG